MGTKVLRPLCRPLSSGVAGCPPMEAEGQQGHSRGSVRLARLRESRHREHTSDCSACISKVAGSAKNKLRSLTCSGRYFPGPLGRGRGCREG